MTNRVVLQYYCSGCNTVLRETDCDIGVPGIAEPCPFCGSLLSESLQKRHLAHKAEKVVFQTASKMPRLTVGIKKIDSILPFLSMGQRVLLVGPYSQKLIERLAVRAQLPPRCGGLDSYVVIVDGGNSSDPYLGISLARQCGLGVEKTLSKIISSRAFTAYQLENLVSKELPEVMKKYGARLVMLSDMLAMFVDDPYLGKDDAEKLLASISRSVSALEECLVVASISSTAKYGGTIMRSFDRIIHLRQINGEIAVCTDDKVCVMREKDLEVISG